MIKSCGIARVRMHCVKALTIRKSAECERTIDDFVRVHVRSDAMSGETNCKDPSASSSPVSVVLTAEDIPGAALREPYESYAVPALRWWLLCRGIRVSTSQRKAQLISR